MTLIFKMISYELIDDIALITINDPPANTISYDLLFQLEEVLFDLIFKENISGIVITGAGDKFYSGGVNINMLHYATDHFNSNFLLYAAEVLDFFSDISAYKVSAINGNITGGGLELALIADTRFAAEGSYNIGFPETRLGVIPGMGGTQRLARLVGAQKALEHITKGEFILPEEGKSMGLVDAIFSKKELLDEAIYHCQQKAPALEEKSSLLVDLNAFKYCTLDFEEGMATISLSGDITSDEDILQLLNELNRCVLKFRLDDRSSLVIINVQSLYLPDITNSSVQDYLNFVVRRIESTPNIFVYYTESDELSDTSSRIGFACDYRFSKEKPKSIALDLHESTYATRYQSMIGSDDLFNIGDLAEAIRWSKRFVPPHGASKAIGYVKLSILKGSVADLESGMMLERHLQEQLFTSFDGKEGMNSYLKKRVPEFKGI